MADTKKADKADEAVAPAADHDRVTMLSLRSDGTPDQTNPEIIGDKEAALAATKEQFRQQAVAAVDTAANAEAAAEEDTSDAAIDAVKAEHDKAAAAAEKQAEAVVESLHK